MSCPQHHNASTTLSPQNPDLLFVQTPDEKLTVTNGLVGPLKALSLESLETQNPLMHKQAQASLADLPVHSIDSISSSDLLWVEGRLCHFPVQILIDGGSRGNFVSIGLVQEAKLRVPSDDPDNHPC